MQMKNEHWTQKSNKQKHNASKSSMQKSLIIMVAQSGVLPQQPDGIDDCFESHHSRLLPSSNCWCSCDWVWMNDTTVNEG